MIKAIKSCGQRWFDMGARGPVSGFLSGGTKIAAGQMEKEEAERQADIVERETEEKIKLKIGEQKQFLAQQQLGYLKSGVLLTGSPLLVLSDTAKKAKEDVKAVRRGGRAKARSLRERGRVAFLRGIGEGSADIIGGFGI